MSNLNKARPPPYDLVGVLVHQGQTCASGHYLSFVKKNGEWFKCNDSEVTKVDKSTVMMQQAYILMYEVAEMRENACFAPKSLRKEASIMSTIESSDDATLSKGDFSVSGSTYSNWSTSDKSTSKRSSSYRDAIGSHNNPYGADHYNATTNNESTTESILRVLRETSSVTSFISDNCCGSATSGIIEPETREVNNTNIHRKSDLDFFNSGGRSDRKRTTNKYAHECESVDTQDSLIRRQALLNRTPINVLDVQYKRKPRANHRSQTAPRQRADSYQESAFHMVSPYSTFTPRGDGRTNSAASIHRKFPSNENLSGNNDNGSATTSSTRTLRSRERDRHSFSATRYSMQGNEDLPPRNPGGRRRHGKSKSRKKSLH